MTLLTLLLAHGPAWAATQAQLTPDTVAPGQPATLTITTDTGATPRVATVPGVQIAGTGRSTQVEILNGSVSQRTTFTYRLIPNAEGTYDLGPYTVGPDQTPKLTLHADPTAASSGGGISSRSAWPGFSAGAGRTTPPAQAAQPSARADDARAFARMWIEDTDPVVGQAVPLTISAYLRDDVGGTLEAAPTIEVPDFIVEGLDEEPTRSETQVDGVPYTRFTWTANLTPVRAGEYELSTSIPATIQWIEHTAAPRRRSLFDSLLADDPFFQNSPFQSMIQQFDSLGMGFAEPQVRSAHVNLTARRTVTVELPPMEGRPDNYTGAVGNFELDLVSATTDVSVGEPIELVWTVSGQGNFDALDMPGVADGDSWDSYPVERAFEPANRSRTKGTLTLTQLVVPRTPGDLSLPPLSLSWFDPGAATYRSSELEIPTIHVTGTAASTATAAATGTSGDAIAPPRRDVRREHLLPPTARVGVLGVVGALWTALAAVWLVGDRVRASIASLLGIVSGQSHIAALRRRVRRAIERGDADAVIEHGLALVEAGAVDRDADATQAFIIEAERTLYGKQTPNLAALSEYATAMLDDRSPLATHKEAA